MWLSRLKWKIHYINVLVYCACIEDNKVIGIDKDLQRNILIK